MTQPAGAATTTIEVLRDGSAIADVTCSNSTDPVCTGFYDPIDDWSDNFASYYDQEGNANEDTVAMLLNDLLGDDLFSGDEATRTEVSGEGELFSFDTAAQYFVLKIADGFAFFQNMTGETIDVVYDQTGTAAGLSNITFFGFDEPEVIPIPATLPLFLTGLFGLGFLGHRRRQAEA